MKIGNGMLGVRMDRRNWLAVTLAAVGVACATPMGARAGDRITFSDPKAQVDLPSKNLKLEQQNSKPFDFLQRNKSGPGNLGPAELPPSLSPSNLHGRQLRDMEQLLDRQKNWIFLRPEDFKSTSTPEETFGVDDASLTGEDQKPKKLIEQYMESTGRDSQSRSNSVTDSSHRADDALSDTGDTDSGSRGAGAGSTTPSLQGVSARAGERGLSPLLDQLRASDGIGRSLTDLPGGRFLPGDAFGFATLKPAVNDPAAAARLKASEAEFRKLILPGGEPVLGAPPVLSGLGDPINSPLDQTRPAINPVAPMAPLSTVAGKGPLDTLPSLNGLGRDTAISGFGSLGAGSVGPSSLSPVIAAPAVDSPFNQAKPVLLEIPRPRF